MPILNLRIDQGTTFSTDLTVNQDVDTPLDLTGYTLRSEIRKHYRSVTITETLMTIIKTGVSRITIDDGSTDYISAPTVIITAQGGDTPSPVATATATVVNGVLTEIVINEIGSGYNNIPLITFSRTSTEFVSNGTFDTDLTDWPDISIGDGSISWNASGYMDLNDTATGDGASQRQVSGLTIGDTYSLSFDLIDAGAQGVTIWLGEDIGANIKNMVEEGAITNLGNNVFTFISTVTDPWITIQVTGATTNDTVTIDNFSIQKIATATAITETQDGKINISLTDAQTSGIKAGRYVYDLESVLPISIISVVSGNTSINFSEATGINGEDQIITDGVWDSAIRFGTIITVSNAEDAGNNISFTILTRTSDTVLTLISTDNVVPNSDDTTASFTGVNNTIDRIIEGIITVTPEVTRT